MKLFWFLVSCVIVIVSTNERMDYKRSVSITNKQLSLINERTLRVTRNGLVENALEHVIEKLIENDYYSLEFMNNMLAVPDFIYRNSYSVCEDIQSDLQRLIQRRLGFSFPNDPDLNFASDTLEDLAAQRRIVTLEALKRMWNRTIVANLYTVHWGCRFIAVFISTKWPEFVTQSIADGGDLCTISNMHGITHFRKLRNGWNQVVGNDINFFEPLQPEPVVTHLQ